MPIGKNRIGNLKWCKCGHCKNEATEIDCLCCIETEMDAMYINSAKNTQRKSSISPSYSGPAQIASFSRWQFSQNKKHDTFKSRLLFRK